MATRPSPEYRQNGFLYAIKVTPKNGKPYFLVRADGSDGNFIRSDQPDMLIPALGNLQLVTAHGPSVTSPANARSWKPSSNPTGSGA